MVAKMQDMSLDEDDQKDYYPTISNTPKYPYGLCISLCDKELEKLGLLDENLEPGDLIHLTSMALVTSVNMSQSSDGSSCKRVELTLAYLGAEDEESEEDYDEKSVTSRLYK